MLLERLDGSTEFRRRLADWAGEPVADAVALRAAGALHGLARSGRAERPAALYPRAGAAQPLPDGVALGAVIKEVLPAHDPFLCVYLDSPPQTNEVARCSVLLGAALLCLRWPNDGQKWDPGTVGFEANCVAFGYVP